MSVELYVAGADIGASNVRAGLWTPEGDLLGWERSRTDIDNYAGTVEWVCETVDTLAKERGGCVGAISLAVAAEVIDGELTKAEDLTPWLGKRPATDVEDCLSERGHRPYFSGVDNDTVAIARSQTGIDAANGYKADGTVVTWSSGYNAATYRVDGSVQADEAGHEHLRPGATCGCGADGHVGAHVSGNGVAHNSGIAMSEWLEDPANQAQLVTDMSLATIQMLERHRRDRNHFAEELRWTGGVALGNPDLAFIRVASQVRKALGPKDAPAFETVTMGDLAGMHGAAVAAQAQLQRI